MKLIKCLGLLGVVAGWDFLTLARATVDTSEYEDKKTVTILSIDGGGMRGIIPARILEELEQRVGKPLATKFDVMAGTSTGGIIALGLNVPSAENAHVPKYSPKDLREIYSKNGTNIFPQSRWRDLRTGWGFLAPRYDARGFESVAEDYFGDTLLSESITNTLIPGCEIGRYEPIFFRSSKAKVDDGRDFFMKDVARATSAAPTFFEPAEITSLDGTAYHVIDGGVIVNNPAMSALVSARQMFPDADDFMVVSIGTGRKMSSLGYDSYRNQGAIGWVKSLIGLMMDGTSTVVDYQLNELLPDHFNQDGYSKRRYFRIQPVIPQNLSEMDDTSPATVEQLTYVAEQMLRTHDHSLSLIADELRRHRIRWDEDDDDSDLFAVSDADDEYATDPDSDDESSDEYHKEKVIAPHPVVISISPEKGPDHGLASPNSSRDESIVKTEGEQDSPRSSTINFSSAEEKTVMASAISEDEVTDLDEGRTIVIPKLRMSAIHDKHQHHKKRSGHSATPSPRSPQGDELKLQVSPGRVAGGSFDVSAAAIERPSTPVKRGLSSLINPKRGSKSDIFERSGDQGGTPPSPELSRTIEKISSNV